MKKYVYKNWYLFVIMILITGRIIKLGLSVQKENMLHVLKNTNRKILVNIIATALLLLSGLIFLLPTENYLLSILRSFNYQVIFVYLTLGVFLILFRFRLLAIISIISAIILILTMNIQTGNAGNHEEADFRVAQFNVLVCNQDYESTINKALGSGADIVSFQEVNEKWRVTLLKGMSEIYPWSGFTSGYTGIESLAIFSKYPLINLKNIEIAGMPNLEGDILFQDTSVHFISTHTCSPITYSRYMKRNDHLEELAMYLGNFQGALIVLGDFNAVPWDASIHSFKRKSKLLDSRKNLTPTFPSFLKSLGIPIDYIFHSNDISCVDFMSIDGTSSDHLGIIGFYKFKNNLL